MDLTLNVKVDAREAIASLRILRKDIPFVMAAALTKTVQEAKKELEREMPRVFDRPTPFTLSALYVKPATKQRLYASVGVKDHAVKGNAASKWLWAQVTGGTRRRKGFEKLLSRTGVITSGYYVIPTSIAPLDQYGNVKGGYITRMLSQLKASRDPTANVTKASAKRRRRARTRIFAISPDSGSHLPPGIYERASFAFGSAIRPVFFFTKSSPSYSKRFDFYRIVPQVASVQFPLQFRRVARQYLPYVR